MWVNDIKRSQKCFVRIHYKLYFQYRKTNCVVALHVDLADLPQLCRQLVARIICNMNHTLFHKSKSLATRDYKHTQPNVSNTKLHHY